MGIFMKLIGRQILDVFVMKHTDAKNWIENWVADVLVAEWSSSHDIKVNYVQASFLANNIVIFNVKGNHYRLVVQVAYNTSVVFIKWIGTHAEYDRCTF